MKSIFFIRIILYGLEPFIIKIFKKYFNNKKLSLKVEFIHIDPYEKISIYLYIYTYITNFILLIRRGTY